MNITFEQVCRQAAPGLILEFGVSSGGSIRNIARHVAPRIVYGFDCWEGLPEDWCDANGRVAHRRGDFKSAPPSVPDNVRLVSGLFQDSLIPFLREHTDPVGFVHFDCDLYSSTKFVLDALSDRFNRSVVVFDEYQGFPEYENHEQLAFTEFCECDLHDIELVGNHSRIGAVFVVSKKQQEA